MVLKIVLFVLICTSLVILSSCNWFNGPDRWLMNNSDSQPTEVEKQIILIDTPVMTSTLTPALDNQTETPIEPTHIPQPSETPTSITDY